MIQKQINHLRNVLSVRTNQWLILKVATIIFATLALFFNDLSIVFSDALHSEVASHILAVPFIFAYMLYRKRRTLRVVLSLENTQRSKRLGYLTQIAGTLLITTSILLYWYGSYTFTPIEYHLSALPIFAAGTILLLFNPKTLRHTAFPIVFLFFLIPPPSEFLFTIGSLLSTLSAQISSAIASTLGIPLTLISEYGNPLIQITRSNGVTLNFTVDIACSGIYGIIGFIMFATLIAYVIRDKPWKKIALVLTGIPIMYVFNILRITTLLILGYHFGENLALQTFHLLGGWVLIFIGTLLLLFISDKIFKTQMFAKKETCPQCTPKQQCNQSFCQTCGKILKPAKTKMRKTDLVKIAAILTAVMAFALIQAPIFALTQSPAVVLITTPAGQQVSTDILPSIPGYVLQFDYRDTDFEELAEIDMALSYIYVPQDRTQKFIWVSVEISSARTSLHRWETCLITYPLQHEMTPRATQIDLYDVQLFENPPIIGRYFAFQYTQTNKMQAVLYWYESATFKVNSTLQQKHVKISLIGYPNSMEELPQIENLLLMLATPITEYWQPIKTWSPIALTLSQNGAQLTEIASSSLIAILILYGLENRRQKQINKTAYTKLSKINQQLIDAVKKTEKTTVSTLENIAKAFQETTRKPINKKELLQKLTELENVGLIRSNVTSKQDEPLQTWTT